MVIYGLFGDVVTSQTLLVLNKIRVTRARSRKEKMKSRQLRGSGPIQAMLATVLSKQTQTSFGWNLSFFAWFELPALGAGRQVHKLIAWTSDDLPSL